MKVKIKVDVKILINVEVEVELDWLDIWVKKCISEGIQKKLLEDTDGEKGEKGKDKDKEKGKDKDKKVCFVTSLYGKDISKCDLPGKFDRLDHADYLLLTNFSIKDFDTSWDVISMGLDSMRFRIDSPEKKGYNIMRSRYPKFMLWRLFQESPEYFLGYDWENYRMIVYCDAFLSPRIDFDWGMVFQKCVFGEKKEGYLKILQDCHNDKRTRELGIREDCRMILRGFKDSGENITGTLNLFQNIIGKRLRELDRGVEGGYRLNTFFAYDPRCKSTCKFLQEFWNMYNLNNRKKLVMPLTYRDQPIWNFWLIYKGLRSMVLSDLFAAEGNGRINLTSGFTRSGLYRGHNISYYS